MQLSRPSNMQHLALSKFTGLTSLYLGPLIKSFLKTLILMICRSPVTICLWCLSAKGELLNLHGRLSRFVKNKSKSRLLINLLKLKNSFNTWWRKRLNYTWVNWNTSYIYKFQTFTFKKYTAHILRWFLFQLRR